jgi:hypothetical protein
MPELKNTFTGGKMNKDLDERIISSTDYRDALNIGVATSEDSDVGAAQNILGNTRVSCAIQGPANKYLEASRHITAIADHRNDKIYRLVHTPGDLPTVSPGPSGVWMDRIVEFDVNVSLNASCEEKEKAVMIDIYQVITTIDSIQYECDGGPVTISVSGNVFQLRWGMLLCDVGGEDTFNGVTVLSVNVTSTTTADLLLSTDNNGDNLNSLTTGNVMLKADRVLNFSPDRFITGINILDGMIFWTDNYSEPKKVNIERGLAGSLMTHELSNYQYKSFDQHTRLIVNDINPTECTKISPNECGPTSRYQCVGNACEECGDAPLPTCIGTLYSDANCEGKCGPGSGTDDPCATDTDWINMPWGTPISGNNYNNLKNDYCNRCTGMPGGFPVTFPHPIIPNGFVPDPNGIDYCGCCPPQPAPVTCDNKTTEGEYALAFIQPSYPGDSISNAFHGLFDVIYNQCPSCNINGAWQTNPTSQIMATPDFSAWNVDQRSAKHLMLVGGGPGYRHNVTWTAVANGGTPQVDWCKSGTSWIQNATWIVQPEFEIGDNTSSLVPGPNGEDFGTQGTSSSQYSITFHTWQDVLTWVGLIPATQASGNCYTPHPPFTNDLQTIASNYNGVMNYNEIQELITQGCGYNLQFWTTSDECPV